jgi:hypothetical protein
MAPASVERVDRATMINRECLFVDFWGEGSESLAGHGISLHLEVIALAASVTAWQLVQDTDLPDRPQIEEELIIVAWTIGFDRPVLQGLPRI